MIFRVLELNKSEFRSYRHCDWEQDVYTMTTPSRIDNNQMAQRVSQELTPGRAVALGPGLPGLVPGKMPPESPILFLSEGGALGYQGAPSGQELAAVDSSGQGVGLIPGGSILSTIDVFALVRGGYADTVVLQPAQVSAQGDFSHWTTAATPALFSPGWASDLANAPGKVIAILPHSRSDGNPNIVSQCTLPVDGPRCVGLIVTDVAVLKVGDEGLVLEEVAPGWKADNVVAITGAPLSVSPNLREMSFEPVSAQLPNKVYSSGLAAIHDLPQGATIMIDGFAGPGGMPSYLMVALRDHGAGDLTLISNTAGVARVIGFGTPAGRLAIDHSILVDNHQIKKAVASFPVSPSPSRPSSFELALQRGEVEVEVVPQGTLAERIRAGGAGVAAFYTPTAAGTQIAEGKESRIFDGREYILEEALRADFCLIRGYKADTLGNIVYKGTSRNFNSVMAPAARTTIIEVEQLVEPGGLNPEEIVTPGVFIDRIVLRPPGFLGYE